MNRKRFSLLFNDLILSSHFFSFKLYCSRRIKQLHYSILKIKIYSVSLFNGAHCDFEFFGFLIEIIPF